MAHVTQDSAPTHSWPSVQAATTETIRQSTTPAWFVCVPLLSNVFRRVRDVKKVTFRQLKTSEIDEFNADFPHQCIMV